MASKWEMWNVRGIAYKYDYVYAIVPEHPKATKNGYVLLHRVVMENYIGRLIEDDEVVHHLDRNKAHNEIDNLELMKYKEHISYHGKIKPKLRYVFCCPNCGKTFRVPKKRAVVYFENKGNCFCSRHCSGLYTREKKLRTLSEEKQKWGSHNFIRKEEYCEEIDTSKIFLKGATHEEYINSLDTSERKNYLLQFSNFEAQVNKCIKEHSGPHKKLSKTTAETKKKTVKKKLTEEQLNTHRRVKNRPDEQALRFMVDHSSYEEVGRLYGVSGNAVRKWLNVPKGEKKIIDAEAVVATYQRLGTVKATAKELDLDQGTVRKYLRENNVEIKTSAQLQESTSTVIAYDIETGEQVKAFSSPYDAAKWLIEQGAAHSKIKPVKHKISLAARGERKSAYGYAWKKIEKS